MKKGIFLFMMLSLAFISCNKPQNHLYRVQENGLYGFIDSLGNVVIEPQYKYVGFFTKDGYACVVSDIKLEKDSSYSTLNDLDSSNISDIADSCLLITYGYINLENELVVDTINHIYIPFRSLYDWGDRPLVHFAQKYINGQLDFRSNMLHELNLSDGLFVFQDEKSKLFGYKDANGKVKIEANYRSCHQFCDGVAVVRDIKKPINDIGEMLNNAGVIDTDGHLIVSDYTHIQNYNNKGLTWALTTYISREENTIKKDWVQLDKKGNIKTGPISNIDWIYNTEQFPVCVCNMLGTYYTFLDENGDFLSDFNNDKMLQISFKGNERDELFTDVTYFSNGVAGIKGYNQQGESAWFFIDRNFYPMSEPYDSLLPFSESLAAVKQLTNTGERSPHLGKWGFVKMETPDSVISQAIPFSFSECGSFSGGLAYFRNEGSTFDVEGFINKQGNIVWQTKRKHNQTE